MKILLTGATGFIGGYLTKMLEKNGHKLTILSRNPKPYKIYESNSRTYAAWETDITPLVENAEAIINLAGKNVSEQRWNRQVKKQILDSRLSVTNALVSAIQKSKKKPSVMVSASGVNYYGDAGDQWVDEHTKAGEGFLAEVCKKWEEEALKARESGVRVAITRFGLPLEKNGGVLQKMLLPFKLFVGGPLGSGRQYMPWTHIEDLCRAILYIIDNDRITGIVNISSPNPVTMNEFAKTLGNVLKRPSWLKVPQLLIHVAVGEVAGLISDSLRIIPRKLTEHGFEFKYPELEDALKDVLK